MMTRAKGANGLVQRINLWRMTDFEWEQLHCMHNSVRVEDDHFRCNSCKVRLDEPEKVQT